MTECQTSFPCSVHLNSLGNPAPECTVCSEIGVHYTPKSGVHFGPKSTEAFSSLLNVRKTLGDRVRKMSLVYGGLEHQQRSEIEVLSYHEASNLA